MKGKAKRRGPGRLVVEFEQSLKKYPPISPGTLDPYTPPKLNSRYYA
jgi:hypothetical protein